jgi:dUTP pyrophosphatase
MEKVAKFYKISSSQWIHDVKVDENATMLEEIPMPTRSSIGSAGYDIHTPYEFTLKPGEDINIPTGLKCQMKDGWFLMAVPRSGLGFKFYTRLANTVGIIDSSYYNNDSNEGHMWVKLRNEGDKDLVVNKHDRICQMIFVPFGITEDDEVTTERTGGFGSSGK